jgi:uncharacterized repeat protein (TIGR03803 family)
MNLVPMRLIAVMAGLVVGAPAVAFGQVYDAVYSQQHLENPQGRLVKATDGYFYGTTASGGASNNGTIFKLSPNGEFTHLHSFSNMDGRFPSDGVVEGSDGNFYGTTCYGGQHDLGTVYRITPSGVHTVLLTFSGPNGSNPRGTLVEGDDGHFYGTTVGGGGGYGTIYKISPSGTYSLLLSFGWPPSAYGPSAGLLKASDGNFYGTTNYGGTSGCGTVFKMTPQGTLTVIRNLAYSTGHSPRAKLVEGTDGNFYGITRVDYYPDVAIFRVTPTGTYTRLHTLDRIYDDPRAEMVKGHDGLLYGTTAGGGEHQDGTVFRLSYDGVLTILHSFESSTGAVPTAGLTVGDNGDLYGTTSEGGKDNCGTVFKITTDGTFTLIRSIHGPAGFNPAGGIVESSDGHFYGTTAQGGANACGTIYKLTKGGAHTLLHTFIGTDGRTPTGELVVENDGSLIGTTKSGGANNLGCVFRLSGTGTLTVLHSFSATGGNYPCAGLVKGTDGDYYGTTHSNGTGHASNYGTIFKVSPNGTHTLLHAFDATNPGKPETRLLQGADGDFYGTAPTTFQGFAFKITSTGVFTRLSNNSTLGGNFYPSSSLVGDEEGNFYGISGGAVYKMTPAGVFTSFRPTTGAPGVYAKSLFYGGDSVLYGTAGEGGAFRNGMIFRMTTAGVLSVLHSFDGTSGAYPEDGPILSADGNVYGAVYPMVVWRCTTDCAPSVTTLAAASRPNGTTTLHGTVNANGLSTSAWIDYGPDTTYGNTVPVTLASVSGLAVQNVSATISGLTVGSLYYYRVRASNSAGSAEGEAKAFTQVVDSTHLTHLATSYGTLEPRFSSSVLSYSLSVPTTLSTLTITAHLLDQNASFTVNGSSNTQVTIHHGSHPITVRVSAQGGVISKDYTIHVTRSPIPTLARLLSKGEAVPQAGVSGGGIPAGAVWSKLGIPAINDLGHIAVHGEWKVGSTVGSGIFSGGVAPATMSAVALKGSVVTGLTDVVLGTLSTPLLAPDGALVWTSTLANAPGRTGVVSSGNNIGLFLDADGSGSSSPSLIARKGAPAPGMTKVGFSSFDSVSVSEKSVAFLGRMKLASGLVTSASDQALWVYNRVTATTIMVLREGQPLLGSKVKGFSALMTRTGASGQGHGVENDGTVDQIVVRVTLADSRTAIGTVAADGSLSFPYVLEGSAPGYGIDATWSALGLPVQNEVGAMAFVGTVKVGNVTTASNTAIFTENDTTFTLSKRLARGDFAGLGAAVFSGFSDPVNAGNNRLAFVGNMATDSFLAITSASNGGVWHQNGYTLRMVAREGSNPPGTTAGTKWKTFTSVALPQDRGPLFLATLARGPGQVTAARDRGLWATDSTDTLHKVIQEGDPIGTSRVASFQVLSTVNGSQSQTRSFNDNGEIVLQVTDIKGGTHLLHVSVP